MAILERYKDRLDALKGGSNDQKQNQSNQSVNRPNTPDGGAYGKKGSFGQRMKQYFPQVWIELKKVTWPKRKEIVRGTWIVIGVSVATALVLGMSDLAFQYLLKWFL